MSWGHPYSCVHQARLQGGRGEEGSERARNGEAGEVPRGAVVLHSTGVTALAPLSLVRVDTRMDSAVRLRRITCFPSSPSPLVASFPRASRSVRPPCSKRVAPPRSRAWRREPSSRPSSRPSPRCAVGTAASLPSLSHPSLSGWRSRGQNDKGGSHYALIPPMNSPYMNVLKGAVGVGGPRPLGGIEEELSIGRRAVSGGGGTGPLQVCDVSEAPKPDHQEGHTYVCTSSLVLGSENDPNTFLALPSLPLCRAALRGSLVK